MRPTLTYICKSCFPFMFLNVLFLHRFSLGSNCIWLRCILAQAQMSEPGCTHAAISNSHPPPWFERLGVSLLAVLTLGMVS